MRRGPRAETEAAEPAETEAEPAPVSTPATVGGGPSKGDQPAEAGEAEPAPE